MNKRNHSLKNLRNSRFVPIEGDFEYISPSEWQSGKRPKPKRIIKITS